MERQHSPRETARKGKKATWEPGWPREGDEQQPGKREGRREGGGGPGGNQRGDDHPRTGSKVSVGGEDADRRSSSCEVTVVQPGLL
ncbi:hypothetical protein QQ045_029781 [Rhodiola kirilowii]